MNTASATIRLIIESGPNKGRACTSAGGQEFVVGRCATVAFSIMDRRLSRRHFSIEIHNEQWRIRDLESKNGTIVNGATIDAAYLKNGDRILAGDTIMRVTIE